MTANKARMPMLINREEPKNPQFNRPIELIIQVIIVVSLISFSIETIPDLKVGFQKTLDVLEILTISIFSLEYLTRVSIAKNKLGFIFSFYGLVDLFSVLPFFLCHGLDLRALRSLRLFRLLRIFKLLRHGKAAKRLVKSFVLIKEEMTVFFFVTCVLLFIAATGIYHFENAAQPNTFKSIFHCLWWAAITLTTVGYGDIYPITIGGKIFTFFMLFVGLGIFAVPVGLVSSALTQTIADEKKEST